MTTGSDGDGKTGSGGSGGSSDVKKARDTISVLLTTMDHDLATQLAFSGISLNYQKVVSQATCCSDVMYLREMIKTMEQPLDEREFSIPEIREHLKKFGYFV